MVVDNGAHQCVAELWVAVLIARHAGDGGAVPFTLATADVAPATAVGDFSKSWVCCSFTTASFHCNDALPGLALVPVGPAQGPVWA